MHKKIILIITSIFVLAACTPPKLSIHDHYLSTDKNIEATISGETEPNAKVVIIYDKMGLGHDEDIVETVTKADDSGHFEQVVDWQTSYTIYAEKFGRKSEEDVVEVKHSREAKEAIDERNKNKH